MKRRTLVRWRGIVVTNVIAAAVVLFLFSDVTLRTPPRQVARDFAIALWFAFCIGPPLAILMPKLAPRVWCRLPFPFNWAAITVVMIAFAVAGSAVATAALVATHVTGPIEFGRWFAGSVRISIAITLTIGLIITGYEMMRARVAQSTVEAQLASLESRVQPHFLFNTLNSIASLIHDDPRGAERMTTQLASLMRASLAGDGALVPLADEIAVVRDYLEIERVRLGDRLRYAIDGEAGIDAQVPRLALQTLVENSVKYAVSPRREGGVIAIGVADGDGHVRIQVDDDGPGFDGRLLPAGHGLVLLKARLAALFGDRAALEIDSVPGRTSVAVRVPRRP